MSLLWHVCVIGCLLLDRPSGVGEVVVFEIQSQFHPDGVFGGTGFDFYWSSRFRRDSIFVFVVIDVVIRYGEFKKRKM